MTKSSAVILRILGSAAALLLLTTCIAQAQETKTGNDTSALEEGSPAPTTGTVVLSVDQDGLNANIGGTSHVLRSGDNRFEKITAGKVDIVISDAAGKEVHTTQVTLSAGGQAAAAFRVYSVLKSNLPDATLRLAETKSATKKAKAQSSLKLKAGNHAIVLERPGHFSFKGTLDVSAGQKITVLNQTEAIPERDQLRLYAWIGVGLGLAMVGTATALEIAGEPDSGALDATKFGLAGVGGVLFVTGGSVIKWLVEEKSTPKEGKFKVQLGAAPIRNGAILGASGKF
ncbi:MAG TPA: hypothetical protein EYN06_09045 [Myxococcales bacterium]|nr:hypothetical protein [Myxococcales bacterium]